MNFVAPIVEAPPSPSPRATARGANDDDFAAHVEVPSDDADDAAAPARQPREQERPTHADASGADEEPDVIAVAASTPQQPVAPIVLQFIVTENANATAAPSGASTDAAHAADAMPAGAQNAPSPSAAQPDEAAPNLKRAPTDAATRDASKLAEGNPQPDAAPPLLQTQVQPSVQKPQVAEQTPAAPPPMQAQSVLAALVASVRPPPSDQKSAEKSLRAAPLTQGVSSDAAVERAAFEHAVTDKGAAKAPARQAVAAEVAPPLAIVTRDADAPAGGSTQHGVATVQEHAQTQRAAIEETSVRHAPAAAQVAREIVRRFDGGSTRFELRLDPPELGRVEVRLEVTRDHRVTAVVAADNPQALAELSKHARDLELSLQSAGLELSENGLSFDLRQSDREFQASEQSSSPPDDASEERPSELASPASPLGYERWRGVRVDMMV